MQTLIVAFRDIFIRDRPKAGQFLKFAFRRTYSIWNAMVSQSIEYLPKQRSNVNIVTWKNVLYCIHKTF